MFTNIIVNIINTITITILNIASWLLHIAAYVLLLCCCFVASCFKRRSILHSRNQKHGPSTIADFAIPHHEHEMLVELGWQPPMHAPSKPMPQPTIPPSSHPCPMGKTASTSSWSTQCPHIAHDHEVSQSVSARACPPSFDVNRLIMNEEGLLLLWCAKLLLLKQSADDTCHQVQPNHARKPPCPRSHSVFQTEIPIMRMQKQTKLHRPLNQSCAQTDKLCLMWQQLW